MTLLMSDMTFMMIRPFHNTWDESMKEDIGNSITCTKQVISYCLKFKVMSFFHSKFISSRSTIIVLRQNLNMLCRQGATGLSVTHNT
jgi:hypothetical protein